MSTDCCEGRDKIKISKLNYLNRQLNAIQDDNIEEQTIAFKKTGNKKTYVTAQRLVYTKSVRELHKKFMELSGIVLIVCFINITHFTLFHLQSGKSKVVSASDVKILVYFSNV